MDTRYLIVIPLVIYFAFSLLLPTPAPSVIRRPWFEPPHYVLNSGWIIMYLILGYLLYRSRAESLDDILIKICVLLFLTYCWGFAYKFTRKYSVLLIMVSLLASYIVYNSIFLSKLTMDNDSTLELNLISAYLIWLTFILSIVMSSGEISATEEVSSIEGFTNRGSQKVIKSN